MRDVRAVRDGRVSLVVVEPQDYTTTVRPVRDARVDARAARAARRRGDARGVRAHRPRGASDAREYRLGVDGDDGRGSEALARKLARRVEGEPVGLVPNNAALVGDHFTLGMLFGCAVVASFNGSARGERSRSRGRTRRSRRVSSRRARGTRTTRAAHRLDRDVTSLIFPRDAVGRDLESSREPLVAGTLVRHGA
jgi:hypothetical protein